MVVVVVAVALDKTLGLKFDNRREAKFGAACKQKVVVEEEEEKEREREKENLVNANVYHAISSLLLPWIDHCLCHISIMIELE